MKRFTLPQSWPKRLQSWINGSFVPNQTGDTLPVMCSANSQKLADFEVSGKAEVTMAVDTASLAQKDWAKVTPMERGKILGRAADILEPRNDELAIYEAYDTSRPFQETQAGDILSARDCFQYYAGVAASICGEHHQMPNGSFAYTVKEPLGVTCGIGAWNYPIQSAAWKIAPALACGNAIVYKPAEDTPLTALALAEVLKEAGLPDGLVNVVLGEKETGQMLTRNSRISKISFTGEMNTAKAICQDASSNLKRVTVECGGKSPLIIFQDADITQAVSAAMMANWYSNGQVCSNGTRVFVHSSIKKSFVAEFERRTRLLKAGHPLDPETQISALIHHAHYEKVLSFIERGKEQGAKLICGGGGGQLEGELSNGPFVLPTIFDDCTDDMDIVKEEIFGPVAAILSFETEEEVVARANNTEFGLSAGVFTKDIQLGHRVIGQLNVGTSWINNYNLAPVELPWSGQKLSGIGCSNGSYGVDDWTQPKSVYVEMGEVYCGYD